MNHFRFISNKFLEELPLYVNSTKIKPSEKKLLKTNKNEEIKFSLKCKTESSDSGYLEYQLKINWNYANYDRYFMKVGYFVDVINDDDYDLVYPSYRTICFNFTKNNSILHICVSSREIIKELAIIKLTGNS